MQYICSWHLISLMRYHSNQNVAGCLMITSTFVFLVDSLILALAHLQSVGSQI